MTTKAKAKAKAKPGGITVVVSVGPRGRFYRTECIGDEDRFEARVVQGPSEAYVMALGPSEADALGQVVCLFQRKGLYGTAKVERVRPLGRRPRRSTKARSHLYGALSPGHGSNNIGCTCPVAGRGARIGSSFIVPG